MGERRGQVVYILVKCKSKTDVGEGREVAVGDRLIKIIAKSEVNERRGEGRN